MRFSNEKKQRMCAVKLLLTASKGKEHTVVEAQSEFRHAREHRLQFNTAHNITAHYASIGIHLRATYRPIKLLTLQTTKTLQT